MAAAGTFDYDAFVDETSKEIMDTYIAKYGKKTIETLLARLKAMDKPTFETDDCLPTPLRSNGAKDFFYVTLVGGRPPALRDLFGSVLKKLNDNTDHDWLQHNVDLPPHEHAVIFYHKNVYTTAEDLNEELREKLDDDEMAGASSRVRQSSGGFDY